MKCTESSRLMRGAREIFYEYILELYDRMDILVGYDVGCTLQQMSIILKISHESLLSFRIVLSEADNVNCL